MGAWAIPPLIVSKTDVSITVLRRIRLVKMPMSVGMPNSPRTNSKPLPVVWTPYAWQATGVCLMSVTLLMHELLILNIPTRMVTTSTRATFPKTVPIPHRFTGFSTPYMNGIYASCPFLFMMPSTAQKLMVAES